MTLYAAGELLTVPSEELPRVPRNVADACAEYAGMSESEQLILVVDETLLGSGKTALAITTERVVRFERDSILVEIALARVHSIRLSSEGMGPALVFNDFRGGSRIVRLLRVVEHETRTMLAELGARIATFGDPPLRAAERWQCSRCGPGEVIHLARVHAGAAGDGFLATHATVGTRDTFWFSAFVCRQCGRSELFLEGAQTLPIDRIAVASLIEPEPGPYR